MRVQRIVETRRFLDGAMQHIDGLTGYVNSFLAECKGPPPAANENGRPWTVESCADALKIPAPTLRRWMGPDQQESAPVLPSTKAQKVGQSHAKKVLRDPEQRRPVLESLSPADRDEVRGELIEMDLPRDSTRCSHCPSHCPQEGSN